MRNYHVFILLAIACLSLTSCKPSTAPNNNNNNNSPDPKASGRVSMAVMLDASRTYQNGGELLRKTKTGQANYVFDLVEVTGASSSGIRSFSWNNTGYGGSSSSFEESTKSYQCNTSQVIDRDTTKRSFNSSGSGAQPGGGTLTIYADGSYVLGMVGSVQGSPTNEYTSSYTYCPSAGHTSHTANLPAIEFIQYFTPFFSGGQGAFTGKISATDPNRVNGSWHGVDSLTVFSYNTTVINVPVDVTIVWDISLK